MNNLIKIIFGLLILGGLGYFFYSKSQDKESIVQAVVKEKNPFSSETYNYIPRDELYNNSDSLTVSMIRELEQRFENQLLKLSENISSTGAKLVYCWFTAEVGDSETIVQREGKKFIQKLCAQNNIEFIDLTDVILGKKPEEVTFYPVDGHLNKYGAQLLADRLSGIIKKYDNVNTSVTYNENDRPEEFGDQLPGQRTETGGKNLPYRLNVNNQGLRMDYDLVFPKTKQRVLLMGDSGFFFPFLDNAFTGTALLQKMFPDKEIINCAKIGYSIDDYNSLWQEKAKYTEPDIVLLQSSGDDIVDFFFTQRLQMSRKAEDVKPTDSELKYYEAFKPKS